MAIEELPQAGQGLHDERHGQMARSDLGIMRGILFGTMKINKKAGFPQRGGVTEAYNLFGPRNAALVKTPLMNKRKGFRRHVETHESTCDTWPTG
jgi:hypothetical protein